MAMKVNTWVQFLSLTLAMLTPLLIGTESDHLILAGGYASIGILTAAIDRMLEK